MLLPIRRQQVLDKVLEDLVFHYSSSKFAGKVHSHGLCGPSTVICYSKRQRTATSMGMSLTHALSLYTFNIIPSLQMYQEAQDEALPISDGQKLGNNKGLLASTMWLIVACPKQ